MVTNMIKKIILFLTDNKRKNVYISLNKYIKKIKRLARKIRPKTIDEYFDRGFIDDYIKENIDSIQGDVLEFAGNISYAKKYSNNLSSLKIMAYKKHQSIYPNADFYCDLEEDDNIPTEKFDCIIATQVLVYMVDLIKVLNNLKKMLKPNGIILITVPGTISLFGSTSCLKFSFTPEGIKGLANKVFGENNTSNIRSYGNLKYAVYTIFNIARELNEPILSSEDEHVIIIGCKCTNTDLK